MNYHGQDIYHGHANGANNVFAPLKHQSFGAKASVDV
jgi:hypothetical protein